MMKAQGSELMTIKDLDEADLQRFDQKQAGSQAADIKILATRAELQAWFGDESQDY